jgi:hypothetical protein
MVITEGTRVVRFSMEFLRSLFFPFVALLSIGIFLIFLLSSFTLDAVIGLTLLYFDIGGFSELVGPLVTVADP